MSRFVLFSTLACLFGNTLIRLKLIALCCLLFPSGFMVFTSPWPYPISPSRSPIEDPNLFIFFLLLYYPIHFYAGLFKYSHPIEESAWIPITGYLKFELPETNLNGVHPTEGFCERMLFKCLSLIKNLALL